MAANFSPATAADLLAYADRLHSAAIEAYKIGDYGIYRQLTDKIHIITENLIRNIPQSERKSGE